MRIKSSHIPIPVAPEYMSLSLPKAQLPYFFPSFQKGVVIPVNIGCSLKNLLCEQLAIPENYVSERITTIFFDNHPVDNLEQTVIAHGSRIALSAAMPGLVGATMRRGGFYAALRQGISHLVQDGTAVTNGSGTVTIKLFNLLLTELVPTFLARGVLLEREKWEHMLCDLSVHHELKNRENVNTCLVRIFFQEKE